MKKILFVCLGNICRSPMAEFLMKDIIKKAGKTDEYIIRSAATCYEEIGNPVHNGTSRLLYNLGISTKGKIAEKLTKRDYEKYDYIIGMDDSNIRNILSIFSLDSSEKVFKLLDITDRKVNIADPWYTGDFNATYNDIIYGCRILFEKIENGEL